VTAPYAMVVVAADARSRRSRAGVALSLPELALSAARAVDDDARLSSSSSRISGGRSVR